MIKNMNEVEERFEAIKDHKPKATKKLNELGDILASAYKLDKDRADEMWQYIIDLNVADDISNAKFYIAQVFKKITERLKAEEATEFIAINPERIQIMIMYGYDGGSLYQVIESLIEGFIKIGNVNNCIVILEYGFDKFGGIHSGHPEIISLVSSAVEKALFLSSQNKQYQEDVDDFFNQLQDFEDDKIEAYVKIRLVNAGFNDAEDIETLLELCLDYHFSREFIKLLWSARTELDEGELIEYFEQYVDDCRERGERIWTITSSIPYDQEIDYEESDICFYVNLVEQSKTLLDAYFSKGRIGDFEEEIFKDWIEADEWDNFTEYLAKALMALTEEHAFSYGFWKPIKSFLETYSNRCVSYSDHFGRKFDSLNDGNIKDFCAALAKISAMTVGCPCHELYLMEVKEILEEYEGGYDTLNSYGFEEEVDKRSAYDQFKDYVHEVMNSGELFSRDAKYNKFWNKLHDEVYASREDYCSNPMDDVEYKMACDDELMEFFFKVNTYDFSKKARILAQCIKRNDIDRAILIIDKMIETEEYEGYGDLNGPGRDFGLTLQYTLKEFEKETRWGDVREEITDQMIKLVQNLVNRALPHIPEKEKREVKRALLKVDSNSVDNDEYITNLLEDVKVYCTFPKPRGKGGAANINRMSSEIMASFEVLSKMGRLDLVCFIMKKFASVRNILKPVNYDGWMSAMCREIKSEDLLYIFKESPEIFSEWLEDNPRDFYITDVARNIAKSGSRADFMSFRNMVVSQKGPVDGLDACFRATSENTESQLLVDGETISIKLDYLEIEGGGYPISDVEIHLDTVCKVNEANSVRIKSCRINGIETENEDMESYSFFEDGGPEIGYRMYSEKDSDSLTIYSDFFDKHSEVKQIDSVEIDFVVMDDDVKKIERLSTAVIELDSYSGEYKVTRVAQNLWTSDDISEYKDDDDNSMKINVTFSCDDSEESDDSNEIDIYISSDDMSDTEFFNKGNIRIEFCGIEFNDEDDVDLSFWCVNDQDRPIKFFAKDLIVNGEDCEPFDHFLTIDNDCSYGTENVSYYTTIRTIDLSIEVDDDDNNGLYETAHIHIDLDAEEESYEVVISSQKVVAEIDLELNDDLEQKEYGFEPDEDFDELTVYDKNDIEIVLEDIEFGIDEVNINFRIENNTDEEIKVYGKNIRVNGDEHQMFSSISTVLDNDFEYDDLTIEGVDGIPYSSFSRIKFSLEIDNSDNEELFETEEITIECNTDDEVFRVSIADAMDDEIDHFEDINLADNNFQNENNEDFDPYASLLAAYKRMNS